MLNQITSTLGVLLDVDWQHNFQSFYETIRVKISCKDHRRIPLERVFGIQGKLYMIQVEVEPPQADAEVIIQEPPKANNSVFIDTDRGSEGGSGGTEMQKSSKSAAGSNSNAGS